MRDAYCGKCEKWFEPDKDKLFFFRSDWKTNLICLATSCNHCAGVVFLNACHRK